VFENRSRKSPSLNNCIRTSGRQVTESITPDVIHYERLPDIEWIQRRNDVNIAIAIQAERTQRAILDLIQGVTIGIGRLELETAIQCVRRCHSVAVVVRVAGVLRLGNDSKSRVRLGSRQSSEWSTRGTESVQGWIGDLFMLPMISHIFCAYRSVPTYELLYFQILLVIMRNLHPPGIEKVQGRHGTSVGKIRAEGGTV
jgi:hypothetical protein